MPGKKPLHDKYADLRKKAQLLLKKQNKPVSSLKDEELADLIQEFNTYQIELELQNEELRQAQIELENSRRKYQELYDFAPTGYITLNCKGLITEANLTASAILGMERRRLLHQRLSAFVKPEDQNIFYHHRRKLLESTGTEICQLRICSSTGAVMHVQMQSTFCKENDTDDGCIRIVLADISALWEIENRLKASEHKFRTVAEFTHDWEYWIGPHGKMKYTSPSCERITGYTVQEFMENPKLILAITHKDDLQLLKNHLDNKLSSRLVQNLDYRIITKNGRTIWVSHVCQPVYDEAGMPCGSRASIRDITNRKKLETSLRDSQTVMRMALDASTDGMWERNLVTGDFYYEEKWYKSLGYTKTDTLRDKLTWIQLIHPEDRETALLAMEKHIAGKTKIYSAEFRMRNKQGGWQWFLSRGKIIEYDTAGKPSRIVGTYKDITVRKHFEIALQKSKQQLESKVRNRTIELEQANIALKVLLKQRSEDKTSMEQHIMQTLSTHVFPYFEQLKRSKLDTTQQNIVVILETTLREIISSFDSRFALQFIKLTPAENKVAHLVSLGRQTKEIAELMNLSPGTISVHRKNIRKKLGLNKKNINLQTALTAENREKEKI